MKALGYDPLELPEASKGREVSKTGACEAWDALHSARALVDSVAYVATEGDSAPVIAAIDAVIARPTPSKREGPVTKELLRPNWVSGLPKGSRRGLFGKRIHDCLRNAMV